MNFQMGMKKRRLEEIVQLSGNRAIHWDHTKQGFSARLNTNTSYSNRFKRETNYPRNMFNYEMK